jgi:diguanylate cyclase (GGDEF)-like protein
LSTKGSIRLYVVAVSTIGITAFVWQFFNLPKDLGQAGLWILAVLVVLSEVFPIQIPRSGGVEEFTTSTTFSFALLLVFGAAAAVIAQGAASVTDDVLRRKPGRKTIFNVAQYSIALVAASTVLDALAGDAEQLPVVESTYLISVMISAGVFFLVNNALIDVAIALEEGRPLLSAFSTNLGFHAFTDAVLLGLAPIAAVTAVTNAALIPLLVLPIVAVARGATSSLRNAKLASELQARARELHHQATHDFLTRLPNRSLFLERVAVAIEIAQPGKKVAALLMDLDRFKEINDTLGHHNGDILLQQVGARLSEEVDGGILVARMGGDEFAALVEISTEMEAVTVAKRVLGCFDRPFALRDLSVEASVSIGMAIFPEHGADANVLVQRADVAMYHAKESRTGFAVYVPEDDPYSLTLLSLVPELREAVDTGQLKLHYQPKVAMSSGHVQGVEALVRWDHPRLGAVNPDNFIPIAERTGLIKRITLFVLDESIRQNLVWRRDGIELDLAINLSANSLHDLSLPAEIADLLSKWNMPADALELEITESAIMSDPVRAGATLQELTDMGLRVAIDDFGTGYSSLSRLRELPVSTIKIDKSFTLALPGSDDDTAIVRSTIELAHNLGLAAVAEGVETATVWHRLAQLGCDYVQGNYVSHPVPAEMLDEWIRGRAADVEGHLGDRRAGWM